MCYLLYMRIHRKKFHVYTLCRVMNCWNIAIGYQYHVCIKINKQHWNLFTLTIQHENYLETLIGYAEYTFCAFTDNLTAFYLVPSIKYPGMKTDSIVLFPCFPVQIFSFWDGFLWTSSEYSRRTNNNSLVYLQFYLDKIYICL